MEQQPLRDDAGAQPVDLGGRWLRGRAPVQVNQLQRACPRQVRLLAGGVFGQPLWSG